jgi:two-component system cell cycle response regulator
VDNDSGVPVSVPEDETAAVSKGRVITRPRAVPSARRPTARFLTGIEAGRVHVLAAERTVIGRGSGADLQIEDAELSRCHCEITCRGEELTIRDLGSRNGTRLDGVRIQGPSSLQQGAHIQLAAGVTLKVSIMDELEIQAAQRLYESAVLDPLTGLCNRRHLDARLRAELAFALRHQAPLSLLIIDVDHFKRINDTRGHPGGDAALRALGERLQRSVRTEDVAGRYGGEEFAIIARGIDPAGALLLAERVRITVAGMRVEHEGTPIAFTVSIGLATHDEKRSFANVDELLKAADAALYKAKSEGRNRCVAG